MKLPFLPRKTRATVKHRLHATAVMKIFTINATKKTDIVATASQKDLYCYNAEP